MKAPGILKSLEAITMCKSLHTKIGISNAIKNVAIICNSVNSDLNTDVDFDALSFSKIPVPPISDRIDITEGAIRGIMQTFGEIASERNLTNADFRDFFTLAHIINTYATDMMKVIECVRSYDGNDNTEQPEASAILEKLYYYRA